MQRSRGLGLVVLFGIALSGCADSDSTPDAATPRESSVTASSSLTPEPSGPAPTSEPATLRETCPQVEAALPSDSYARGPRWAQYLAELTMLYSAGDLETQNALDVLIPAIQDLALSDSSTYLDAHIEMLHALDTMAERCKAAGSSALQ
jgi:hypothetical protein